MDIVYSMSHAVATTVSSMGRACFNRIHDIFYWERTSMKAEPNFLFDMTISMKCFKYVIYL